MTEFSPSPGPDAGLPAPGSPEPGPPQPGSSLPGPAPPGPGSPPPGPAPPVPATTGPSPGRLSLVLVTVAVVAGTALLGVAGGLLWAAVAPHALLVMASPGAADLVHPETSAFITADGLFALIMIVGGVISGLLGYLLAVRRHGPVAMAAVLAGAVAAAFLARWIGELSGRASLHHLLASLPVGAHLYDRLTLGASSLLAFWALAAGLVAGGFEALARSPGRSRGEGSPEQGLGDDGTGMAGLPSGDPGSA